MLVQCTNMNPLRGFDYFGTGLCWLSHSTLRKCRIGRRTVGQVGADLVACCQVNQ